MKRILGLAAAISAMWISPAWAQSCGSPTTNGGLVFGNYTGALIATSNTGHVNCTNAVAYNITASAGSSSGATVTTRKMSGPNGAKLAYVLTRDAAHSLTWGLTSGVNTIQGTGAGAVDRPFTYYGAVSAGQVLTPGTYTDTVAIAAVPQSGTTGSASLTIKGTIVASCTVSATSLSFGAYAGALTSMTSTITAKCTNTTAYNIGLSAGAGSGASVTARKMTAPGGAVLNYSLYRDAARTLNWGNTVGVSTLAGTGNGNAQVLTVYGRMPAQTQPNPGTYSDTVIATLTY